MFSELQNMKLYLYKDKINDRKVNFWGEKTLELYRNIYA